MASFSIDEVRESFSTDMTQFLTQIESAASDLLKLQAAFQSMPMDENNRSLFEAVAAHSHAITGTSSLVGAESLAQCSRVVERITRQGQIAILRAQAQLVRAHQVADLCKHGAKSMREMLELELAHKSSEAMELSRAWQQRVALFEPVTDLRTRDLQVLGEPENRKSPTEFSFGEEATPSERTAGSKTSTSTSPAMAMEEELRAVFQQEAQESLATLQANFESLWEHPEEVSAAEQLERIFHTLKGASATVGLLDVSAQAASLRARLEQLLDSGKAVPQEVLKELLDETNKMLQLASLPGIALPSSLGPGAARTQGEDEDNDETSGKSFVDEAKEICFEAAALVQELVFATAPERITQLYSTLNKLLRRLSGSALVAGENAVADSSAELEAACEKREPTAFIRNQFRQIVTLLGLDNALDNVPTGEKSIPAVREEIQPESDPELWEAFHQECSELLEAIQKETLSLEESGHPKEVLESLMRQHHTLKGAANSVGMAPTARLLHRVEDFLEGLLDAPILPSMHDVVDLLLDVQKEIRSHLETAVQGFVEHTLGHFRTRVDQVLAAGRLSGSASAGHSLLSPADKSSPSATGSSAAGLVAGAEPTDRRTIRVLAERLDSLMDLAGELVVSRSRLSSRVVLLRAMQEELGRAQQRLLECVEEFRSTYEFADLDGRQLSSPSLKEKPTAQATAWSEFGELELDRYDDVHVLSRRIGEISADLDEISTNLFREMAGLADDADSFGGIVSGIQSEVTRARMVPVEKLFTRLLLPIRDATSLEHKETHVLTSGEEVNLDKTIADALFQPMLHLVRNAVVHGIESPVRREANGKNRQGTIIMEARQESGQIVLEVRDDGRGLDLAALHAQGVSLGQIAPQTPLNDPSVKSLVFVPSLSTVASPGMASGRGFGCDVVRRAVEKLNGSIQVETSPGQGTVFTIILPLTLAITRALMVRYSSRVYAIPLFFAEHIFDLEQVQVVESAGTKRMKLDDRYVPIRSLGVILSSSRRATNTDGPVIILRMGDHRLAIQVDSVVSQEEIVVKNLGEVLHGHPSFAGVTIRGNGELALIIDVPGIVEASVGAHSTSISITGTQKDIRELKESSFTNQPKPVAKRSPKKQTVTPVVAKKAQNESKTGSKKSPQSVAEASPTALLAEAVASGSVAAASKDIRVLFVDDSLSVRKVAEKTFSTLGVQVAVAVDGLDALEKLRENVFDIVFTDLEMPRMHGFEFLRELRFLPAWRSLPVVVVSSRSGQKHQDQARTLGANDYLTKPFDAKTLGESLKRWTSWSKTVAGSSPAPLPESEVKK